MRISLYKSIFFLTLAGHFPGFCQFESKQILSKPDTSFSYLEVVGFGSTQTRVPFWIQANQFGVVPKTNPGGSLRAGLQKFWNISDIDPQKSNWKFGVGIEAVGNGGSNFKFLLPQINATLKYKNWELFIGRRKTWVGLADSTLGTGSYVWSGNALPIPKIQLGTTHFVNVPLTKGWISFQAFYSDGFFEKNRPITSGLKFHQKAFYLRLGKSSSQLKLYGGFNHQAQWGGNSPYNTAATNKLPDGFKNYINVVTGKIGGNGTDQTFFDSTSRIGNHLGSLDVAIEIETYETSWFVYRQFIYEDGSLFYLKGIKDGLNGIRVRRKNSYGSNFEISEAVLEFLYTKEQGGDDFVLTDGKKRGRDNYFNNQQVRDGWSYYNRTIGTPFITPTSDTKWKWPNYADNFTNNNRVSVLHLGLRGSMFQSITWYTKFSYSSNSGAYLEPFKGNPTQFSGLLALQTKLNILGGTLLKGSVAADIGDLYPKTYGFTLGLRKDFSF